MTDSVMKRIAATVRHVVILLVKCKYDELENFTNGLRLKAQYIGGGVGDYGRTLMAPPESAYDSMDVIQVVGATPDQYSVRFDLYTKEEGRSDLSIEMMLIDENPEKEMLRVEVDHIHVL